MFEATRHFLGTAPVLALLVETAFQMNPIPGNNPDELRDYLTSIQKQVVAALKESRSLYLVETLPDESFKCPQCGQEVKGAYWEVSNPATGRRGVFSSGLMHGFIEHGTNSLDEPIVNLSNIYVGERELQLDLAALVKVLAGADLPDTVTAECSAFAQNPGSFQGTKLVAR